MTWISTLNSSPRRLTLAGHVDVLSWSYEAHLLDNVPHRHAHFEICLIGDYGRGVFQVQDSPHAIKRGDLFIARPGVAHQIVNTQKRLMELYWISFNWQSSSSHDEIYDLMSNFANSSRLVVPDEDERILSLWRALKSVSENPRIGWRDQVDALTTALIIGIAQLGSEGDRVLDVRPQADNARLLQQAIRYIHDNLDRRLGVQEIADHVHLSSRHLSRLMLQFAGTTPAAYIEHARLERAQALLLRSSTPLKEIAREVGYDGVQHFSRVCARNFGLPPGELRSRGHLPESSLYVRNRQKLGSLV